MARHLTRRLPGPRHGLALLALALLLLLSGCGQQATRATTPRAGTTPTATASPVAGGAKAPHTPAPHAAPAGVAAVANDERIPLWEYHALLELNLENAGAITAPITSATWQSVHTGTVRQIVDEALLNAYAQSHGLAVSAATVQARLEAYRLQSGAGFAASLARLGVSEARFQRMIARNLNAQAVTQRVIAGIGAPIVRVQVLQVIVPSLAHARAIRRSLLHGLDATLAAVRDSSDPNLRRLAGQLPPLTRAQGDALYGPHWGGAAFALRPGQISQPLRVRQGWAIIQCVERQPQAQLMQRALDSFVNSLRQSARITVYVQ